MKVLIIGGTGNISTGIAKRLLQRGDSLTLYNRGKRRPDFEGDFQTLTGDRKEHRAFEIQMQESGTFDCVIDMVGFSPEDAESAVRAFSGRTGRYIFCSTVDVYTKPAKRYPIREDSDRQPLSKFRYAYNKARLEEIFFEACETGNFPLTIIRPAATYQDSSTPVGFAGNHLLHRLREGKPIIVWGDALWAFSHRDDVAHAFIGGIDNPSATGKAYHVAGEELISWKQYYGTLARAAGWPAPDFVSIPTDILNRFAPLSAEWCDLNFQYNNVFDNTAAKEDLNYNYTISWEQGAKRMADWHSSHGTFDQENPAPSYDRIVEAWREIESSISGVE